MCLIVYSPCGRPSGKLLTQGMVNNDDGWGYCFPCKGKLYVRRGLCQTAFWKAWKTDQPWTDNAPILWHARIKTHGKTQIKNCHPFRVPGHDELAFAHNGILNCMEDDNELSDTHLFVRDVLAELSPGFHKRADDIKLISLLLKNGKWGFGKGVLMDGDGFTTILNEDHGHWKSGCWFSNESYKPYKIKTTQCVVWPDHAEMYTQQLPYNQATLNQNRPTFETYLQKMGIREVSNGSTGGIPKHLPTKVKGKTLTEAETERIAKLQEQIDQDMAKAKECLEGRRHELTKEGDPQEAKYLNS